LDGKILSHKQWKEGIRPFCYRKQFTPQIVEAFKTKLENGLIDDYVGRESEIRHSFKFIP